MKIELRRSGGFAGRTSLVELDTHRLSASQEKELRDLMRSSGFFELPAKLPGRVPEADRFHYRITVQSRGETRTVEMDESAVPPSVRPLLEWISRSPRDR